MLGTDFSEFLPVLFEPSRAHEPSDFSDALSRRRRFFSQQLAARPRAKQSQKQEVRYDPPLISRYVMVYYWMDELLSKAAREGLIDPARPEALWKMQESITKMRGAAADVFMYLYCKIPYIYVHLLTLLVKVYLLVIAAVGGSCIKIAWMAGRPTDVFLAVVMIFFINLTYEGLMHVHIRVWNPLGFDRNDFPQRRYMDFVWSATHQFLYPAKRLKPSFLMPTGVPVALRQPSWNPPTAAAAPGNGNAGAPSGYAGTPYSNAAYYGTPGPRGGMAGFGASPLTQGPLVPAPVVPYQAPGYSMWSLRPVSQAPQPVSQAPQQSLQPPSASQQQLLPPPPPAQPQAQPQVQIQGMQPGVQNSLLLLSRSLLPMY